MRLDVNNNNDSMIVVYMLLDKISNKHDTYTLYIWVGKMLVKQIVCTVKLFKLPPYLLLFTNHMHQVRKGDTLIDFPNLTYSKTKSPHPIRYFECAAMSTGNCGCWLTVSRVLSAFDDVTRSRTCSKCLIWWNWPLLAISQDSICWQRLNHRVFLLASVKTPWFLCVDRETFKQTHIMRWGDTILGIGGALVYRFDLMDTIQRVLQTQSFF